MQESLSYDSYCILKLGFAVNLESTDIYETYNSLLSDLKLCNPNIS